MPNIAAKSQESVNVYLQSDANEEQIKLVSELFDSIGFTIPIDESLMRSRLRYSVHAECLCICRFMRAMIQGGIQMVFDSVTASQNRESTV